MSSIAKGNIEHKREASQSPDNISDSSEHRNNKSQIAVSNIRSMDQRASQSNIEEKQQEPEYINWK